MAFIPKKPAGEAPPSPPKRVRATPADQIESATDGAGVPPANYVIGYKQPPKHSQFKAGQSGNPKGRPKGAKGVNTIVRSLLSEKVSVRTPEGIKRMSKMEAAVHKLIEKAFTGGGDLRALERILSLYRASVPDEILSDQATAKSHDIAADDAALDAAFELIRDELRGQTQGEA